MRMSWWPFNWYHVPRRLGTLYHEDLYPKENGVVHLMSSDIWDFAEASKERKPRSKEEDNPNLVAKMDAIEADVDVNDPMEVLVVQRQDQRETFTRYRFQETLMLMGCRPKDAVVLTRDVFAQYHLFLTRKSHQIHEDKTIDHHEPEATVSWSQFTDAVAAAGARASAGNGEATIAAASIHGNSVMFSDLPAPSPSSSSMAMAMPWHLLHKCIYVGLARMEYNKPHHLLDFQVAKEITQRNQSFVVLLGGTSGTGKSTLASLLAARLRLTTVLPTDSVRHILRTFTNKQENPCAFVSTYQAGDAVSDEIVKELSMTSDGTVMTDKRLHKRRVLRGYKLQSDLVLEKLDNVLTMFEKRKQSLVVEGVHLNTEQIMTLVQKHPNCVPFMIYISNELKHRERFAVRARHMTIDPQENKYIKYFDNIRIIQRHLVKHADKYLIPKIDNTNVDRSIATIQSTLVRVLRKMHQGESLVDERIHKMVMLSREHESAIKKAWSSKGVRKAMRPLVKQKVSKRLLLRRLLAEQKLLAMGGTMNVHAHANDDDSSSSEEEGGRGSSERQFPKEEDEDDDEETTVVGSLFSIGTNTKESSRRSLLLEDIEPRTDEATDPHSHDGKTKMMRSLSTAIQQAALWRASQPIVRSESIGSVPSMAPRKSERMAFGRSHSQFEFASSPKLDSADWTSSKTMSPPPPPSPSALPVPYDLLLGLSMDKQSHSQDERSRSCSPHRPTPKFGGRRSKSHVMKRAEQHPRGQQDSLLQSHPSVVDFDIDSISVTGGNDQFTPRASSCSSHGDEGVLTMDESIGEEDYDSNSHFEVSSQSSEESADGFQQNSLQVQPHPVAVEAISVDGMEG